MKLMNKFVAIFYVLVFSLLSNSGFVCAREMSNSVRVGSEVLYNFPAEGELGGTSMKKLVKSENPFELKVDLDHVVDSAQGLLLSDGIDWFLTDNFFINLDTALPSAETGADVETENKTEIGNESISMETDLSSYFDLDAWIIGAGVKFYF